MSRTLLFFYAPPRSLKLFFSSLFDSLLSVSRDPSTSRWPACRPERSPGRSNPRRGARALPPIPAVCRAAHPRDTRDSSQTKKCEEEIACISWSPEADVCPLSRDLATISLPFNDLPQWPPKARPQSAPRLGSTALRGAACSSTPFPVPLAVNIWIWETYWRVTGTHESNNCRNCYFILH